MIQHRFDRLALALIACAIAALIITQNSPRAISATVGMTSTMPTAHGGILVDQQGMTLYTFAKDTAGTSNCVDTCATVWPPVLAPSGATASGKFSIITRTDGGKQWAYGGKPLYLFSKDTAPGQENGNGFKGLWNVVKP
jgi:predicted lipoprotein with Yx(FWY)xxD motif